jgi:hypothetical protein
MRARRRRKRCLLRTLQLFSVLIFSPFAPVLRYLPGRQELAKRYAGMTDLQLERLAKVAYSLRESAKGALLAEILSRTLDVALVEVVPEGPDDVHLIVVRQFLDIPSALLAKSVVDSAEIGCFLADANPVRID